MGVPYQGNDDHALELLCSTYELTAPGNINTRDAIDAAATEAGVLEQLTVNGNDRDRIDELWDILAAVPVLVYRWDGDSTVMLGTLNAPMSNGDLTATVPIEAALGDTKIYGALPAGFATNESLRLDMAVSGSVAFDVTLPAATADNDPGGPSFSSAYSLMLIFASPALQTIILITANRVGDGTLNISVSTNNGNQSVDLVDTAVPAQFSLVVNAEANTGTVYADASPILADIPIAEPFLTTGARVAIAAGILTGGGSSVVVTLDNNMTVVAP